MDANFKPLGNRVLVRRIPSANKGKVVLVHDEKQGLEPIQAEGIVLAAGPGKRNDYGEFVPTQVVPGQRVIFNARWNDFSHAELVGTDCDGQGRLDRPLPIGHDKNLHLLEEGDIVGVLS